MNGYPVAITWCPNVVLIPLYYVSKTVPYSRPERASVPPRRHCCSFGVRGCQLSATGPFQSLQPVFGTVCRSTSHLHRLFPPSEAVWRLTSSAAAIQLSSPRSDSSLLPFLLLLLLLYIMNVQDRSVGWDAFTEFTDASTDDAGMSKHRLSPYNAYYHNWLTKLYSFRFK